MTYSGDEFRALIMPSSDEVAIARRRLHLKCVCIVTMFLVSYATLLGGNVPLAVRLAAYPLVLLALIMVATSIMHDANHGAFFADSPRANRAVGYFADLLGVSSTLWRFKHDTHHADTNVQGIDTDIDQGVIARLAPKQSARTWHRWQHRYLWAIYGFMGIQWLLIDDFVDLARGTVSGQSIANIGWKARFGIIGGKLVHIGWALILPLTLFPWWAVIPTYLVGSWTIGSVLAITFQIAHCVDVAEFATPDSPRRGDDFVWHQLRTTVDVATDRSLKNRVRSFVVGGLDFQIEHHLATHIPHTAYRAMAERTRRLCAAEGVKFLSHDGVRAAIKSHHRWIRTMGTELS
jgi:linoleoyl-CoA desaturase